MCVQLCFLTVLLEREMNKREKEKCCVNGTSDNVEITDEMFLFRGKVEYYVKIKITKSRL